MTQKIFDILSQINAEGIDNTQWTIAEVWGQTSKEYFGTEEELKLDGRYLALYVDASDSFCFVRTETADHMLTIHNDTPYPTALMIWEL